MSTDQLGRALRDLAEDAEAGLAPPVADDLWDGGRRRRRTTRLVPVLAAACVAALVGLLAWPGGAPRAAVPAVQVDGSGSVRLTAYPSVIPKPPFLASTARPGVTAAVVTTASDASELYAVSPAGSVRRLELGAVLVTTPPSLSPDGRWLARGPVLHDLVEGGTVPARPDESAVVMGRVPTEDAAWWSPDSRRVYVDAVNQGEARSSGLVVATDGTIVEAPLLAGGRVPVVAGWLDADTVLAFLDVGEGGTPRLEGRTWRVGTAAWEVSAPDLEPDPAGEVPSAVRVQRAALSPDRSRVLVTTAVTSPDGTASPGTRASVLDARTGAGIGIRVVPLRPAVRDLRR